MRETIKVLCVVVFMFATPAAAVAWFDDRPSPLMSVLKYACPLVSVLAIAGFLKLHIRADAVPDYLHRKFRSYFNRGGFCFALQPAAVGGVGYLNVYFQNQQDAPLIGRIALRPARGFFLGRAPLTPVAVEIRCESAGYGVAKVPIAVPLDLQGKKQSFEAGASAEYPSGKGPTLRFRDGIVLRANSDFKNIFGTALAVAGALTGVINYQSPAGMAIELPTGVAEEVPPDQRPEITTLWKLGDAPLQESAYCLGGN
jgi:hypothetical protein